MRGKMQVFTLLFISFACLVCLSLGKEGNYNEADQHEWLNPWDMTHYDAAAQSLDNTVSLLSTFISLPKLNVSSLNVLTF